MRFMKPFLLVGAIASLSFATISSSNYQQWKFIGDKKVNFLIDRDVIHITGNDNYRQIKLKSYRRPCAYSGHEYLF
jgi:hypothetical protein